MIKVEVIAEIGVNHNGSVSRALQLIDEAVDCGVSRVKFQIFDAELLATKAAKLANYQKNTTNYKTQFEMLRSLEISPEAFVRIKRYCESKNVQFFCSVFDLRSLKFATEILGETEIKLSSGDLDNFELLQKAASTDIRLFLSSGMSNYAQINNALNLVDFCTQNKNVLPTEEKLANWDLDINRIKDKLVLFQCTSEYPAQAKDLNLYVLREFENKYNCLTGLSDHSRYIEPAVMAVALGAKYIEKHFTLDKNLEGPDHQASLNPAEMSDLVSAVNRAAICLGSNEKTPTQLEQEMQIISRKSLISKKEIKKGETFTQDNLTVSRPGDGVPASKYFDVLGQAASKDYPPFCQIEV